MDNNDSVKYNDQTDLRPEGERILDAPLVHMDLNEFSKTIKSEKTWKEKDRNAITVYKTDGMRMVLVALHKGAVLERHIANGNISVQVMDGEINFSTDDQTVNLKEGQAIALHKNIHHEVTAIKESIFLLTLNTVKSLS
jgi:quercetin dioxygenase-like cupin family protein